MLSRIVKGKVNIMSSKRWLQEHFSDPYVKKAKEAGYVSRAAFKLLELQEKDRLIRHGMTVVDLGAAPGGWSQVLLELVGRNGRIVAVDILEMELISGVEFIQGDFTEQECLDQVLDQLGDKADSIVCDMAPNMSGHKSIDQPRSMYLVELAWDFALNVLKPGGSFVAKAFHGEGLEALVKVMRPHFKVVKYRKPSASRPRSPEIYLVGLEFKA